MVAFADETHFAASGFGPRPWRHCLVSSIHEFLASSMSSLDGVMSNWSASRWSSSSRRSSLGSGVGVGISASSLGSSQEASKLGHEAMKTAAPTEGVPDKSRVQESWY